MPDEKEITIYDIAERLNISPATVSRGLKDHPAINKNTKKKILETARELGYQSNKFASSLRSKRTHTIGVIVPKLNSHFHSTVIAGMEHKANEKGYSLIISQSLESAKKEIDNAHNLFNSRVDGIVVSLAADTADISHFEPFIKKNIPLIFFDRVLYDTKDALVITIDNQKAGYEVTSHLIEQGCRRIMHLTGNRNRNVYAERLAGYRQALKEHGIPYHEDLVRSSNLTEEDGIEAGQYILKMRNRPDAVFAANDISAMYCMLQLKKGGLSIPGDIAVAGFNNDPVCEIVDPNLTSVNYPGYTLGEVAATNLINHLSGLSNIKATNSIVLRSELIIRSSSLRKKLR
ncbi:LacI family DNA-binding transcriptional regulator [Chitinophagaceae bacterium MMS25-I14]